MKLLYDWIFFHKLQRSLFLHVVNFHHLGFSLFRFCRLNTHYVCFYLQLLDEMIDNGFPLSTEPNILREMIAPPNIVSKMLSVVTGNSSNVTETLPGATASLVPWRMTDPKYANNEVYVDLVEEMDATINRHGIKLP
jgi:AP-3 complex subunit mu